MDRYLNFTISKRQAQLLAFEFIKDIDDFVTANQAEFDEFLKNEEENVQAEKKDS